MNEYLAIDGGGHVHEYSIRAIIAAWLDASYIGSMSLWCWNEPVGISGDDV